MNLEKYYLGNRAGGQTTIRRASESGSVLVEVNDATLFGGNLLYTINSLQHKKQQKQYIKLSDFLDAGFTLFTPTPVLYGNFKRLSFPTSLKDKIVVTGRAEVVWEDIE